MTDINQDFYKTDVDFFEDTNFVILWFVIVKFTIYFLSFFFKFSFYKNFWRKLKVI